MKSTLLRTLAVAHFLVGISVNAALAAGIRTTDTFAPVAKQVAEYADEYGGDKVLFVADIDNTLLAMDRQLGSDQWFNWQDYLLKHEPQSPHLVADDFPELLEIQGLLFATTHMHPPEAEQPRQLATIQRLGVHTLVLTSRSDDFRPAAIRELTRAGYDFADTSPTIRLFARQGDMPYETCSRFIPYQANKPRAAGLQPGEVTKFGLSDAPRQVSYGDGVFMVAGQHKGAMLLVLLHLTQQQFDAVVYVDDHLKHVVGVQEALLDRKIEVTGFHYTHEQDRVDHFVYGDKQPVTRKWRRIQRALRYTGDQIASPAATSP